MGLLNLLVGLKLEPSPGADRVAWSKKEWSVRLARSPRERVLAFVATSSPVTFNASA